MYELDEFDEDDSTGTVFWDVILLALIGFVAIAALFAGFMEGWLEDLLEGPTFLMTFSIFAIFVHGLIGCAAKYGARARN